MEAIDVVLIVVAFFMLWIVYGLYGRVRQLEALGVEMRSLILSMSEM